MHDGKASSRGSRSARPSLADAGRRRLSPQFAGPAPVCRPGFSGSMRIDYPGAAGVPTTDGSGRAGAASFTKQCWRREDRHCANRAAQVQAGRRSEPPQRKCSRATLPATRARGPSIHPTRSRHLAGECQGPDPAPSRPLSPSRRSKPGGSATRPEPGETRGP